MKGLLGRSLLAFLMLPGVVGFVVPWLLLGPQASARFVDSRGLIPLACGTALLLWCVRAFYVDGRGTLAPWDPPRQLVATGVYRLSRNPMYVAVVTLLLGWTLTFHSWPMAIYSAVITVAFHLRVVFGEEPALARLHGDQWRRYRAQAPRWLGFPSRRDRQQA